MKTNNNKNLKVVGIFLALVLSATISMGALNASTIYEQTITDLETQAELDLQTITDLETQAELDLQTITDLETQAELDLQTITDLETQAELDLQTITDLETQAEYLETQTELDWQTIYDLQIPTDSYYSILNNVDAYVQNLLYLSTLQNRSYLFSLAIANVGGEITINSNNEDIVITTIEMQQFSLMCENLIIDYYTIIASSNFEPDFFDLNNYVNEFLVSNELYITYIDVLQGYLQIVV